MNVVILCEKPSQARNIGSTLGIERQHEHYFDIKKSELLPNGATLVWSVGHSVTLKEPDDYDPKYKIWKLDDLPIKPEKYEYKVDEGKRNLFNTMKEHLASAKIIINATDAGIEGTHIFFAILETAKIDTSNKTLKRLWISSEEKSEVLHGFRNLEPIDRDLLRFERGKARAISDWYLGMNTSRFATLKANEKTPNLPKIAIGRNMQVVLSMVYQRQIEIESFIPKPFYELDANFILEQGDYKGKSKLKFDTKEELKNFVEKNNLASDKNLDAIVYSVIKETKTQNAPALLSLSSLQKLAFKKFKYDPDKTKNIAQSLYEKRVLSYPRTDSKYISENEYEYLKGLVGDLKTLLNIEFEPIFKPLKKHVDASKLTDHYALLPTRKIADLAELSTEERNIYLEVVKSATALFMAPYKYEETKIITNINEVPFHTTGRIEKVSGWKAILHDGDSKDTILPNVTEGQKLFGSLLTTEGRTQSPKAYNKGDLIELMEYPGRTLDNEEYSEERDILSEIKGIGTAATRDETIKKLFKNGYLDLTDKNIVFVTDIGISICKLVEGTSLVSPVITADWEKSLKDIENGTLKGEEFIMTIEKEVTNINEKITENLKTTEFKAKDADAPTCPKCKKGKVINKGSVYGCTLYKEEGCDFSIFKTIAKKLITDKQVLNLIVKGQTSVIKGFKSKEDKEFAAILKLNADGTVGFIFPKNPTCPKCKKGEVVDKGKIVGCTQYSKTGCNFSIFKTISNKELTEKHLTDLVTKGKTGKIKGFRGKSGTEFDAKLILNKDFKIEFDFI